jgi:hypothetical protein
MHAAGRRATALTPKIENAELEVTALRDEFLAKRVERRQAETLLKETEDRDAIEAGRRSQQSLDDWFGNRRHRRDAEAAAESRRDGPTSRKPSE